MKKIILFSFFVFLGLNASAQLFQKVSSGAITTTPSDSRSINFVDVNNDGWEDIFISNGLNGGQNNLLYINNQDGTFSEVSDNDIVEDDAPSVGATFGDYDNDGDLDAVVTNWYGDTNQFYKNDGQGNFSFTPIAGLTNLASFSETASWGDFDNDGLLDLFITNSDGADKSNTLYRNTGNDTFESISTGSWVTEKDASRNVNWTDINNDGLIDLSISNEINTPNDFYTNNGDGSFSKITTGIIALSGKSSMSTSWADIDNDGDLDLFIANAGYFSEQNNQLFRNDGTSFTHITTGDLVEDGGCSYGSNFGDYDNDGDLDLFVTNGYCNNNLPDFLYENDGLGNFTRKELELPDIPDACSYGTAWGDINNDGFLDLMIAQCKNTSGGDQPPNTLYTNKGNGNNWIKVKLIGTISNTAAIGAKIRIKATIDGNPVWQLRELSAQSGYCGQNSLNTHFGLGDASTIDSVVVEWPSGIVNTVESVPTNQQFELTEMLVDGTNEAANSFDLRIDIFPNPASETLSISIGRSESNHSNPRILQLIDSTGRIWMEKRISHYESSSSYQINWSVSHLPNGLYFVGVKGEGGTQKVIIQR